MLALPPTLVSATGAAVALTGGRNGSIPSSITNATPPYTSHSVALLCPSRLEPSASRPVSTIPNPGPANTSVPARGRPAAIASGWLRLVIITNAQALATPVPNRSSRCGQNPWAQYEARVSSAHSHSPPYRRPRMW